MELSDLEKKLAANPDLGVDCGNLRFKSGDAWEVAAEIAAMPTRDMGKMLTSSKRRPQANKATGSDVVKESEADFQSWVIDLFKRRGYRVCHFRPAKTDKGWRTPIEGDPGFFDVVAAKEGYVWLIELKAEDGKLTADQISWQKEANGDGTYQGHVAEVWRPWMRDYILQVVT